MHHTTYLARSQFRNTRLLFHVYTQKKLVEQCFNITYLGAFSNTVNKETHMLFNTCSFSERSSWSKHCPQFDNIQLKCLPIDNGSNSIRSVPNACFTRVSPTRIDNPRVVLFSLDALSLLNIRHEVNHLDEQNCIEKTGETNHLVEYLSGNKLWPGSDPTAHCYCGYQFGSFAGQLGDGAAMYVSLFRIFILLSVFNCV
uniref:Selenoprotein O n=1 Tax=Schistosoma haematobium TaxID=6185 RepID=A0A095A526_SCHHA